MMVMAINENATRVVLNRIQADSFEDSQIKIKETEAVDPKDGDKNRMIK